MSAVAVVLLLLSGALFVHLASRKPASDRPGAVTITAPEKRSTTLAPTGRERCTRKCAAQHLGYVYRAEQRAAGPGSPIIQAETCTCM